MIHAGNIGKTLTLLDRIKTAISWWLIKFIYLSLSPLYPLYKLKNKIETTILKNC